MPELGTGAARHRLLVAVRHRRHYWEQIDCRTHRCGGIHHLERGEHTEAQKSAKELIRMFLNKHSRKRQF